MSWKYANEEKIREYNRQYYLKKTKAKMEAQKALKALEEKPTIEKKCPICNKVFTTTESRRKYCSDECKRVHLLQQQKEYRKTDRYKEKVKEYYKSESYKASRRRYMKSEKGKQAMKRYLQKVKEKESAKVEIEEIK